MKKLYIFSVLLFLSSCVTPPKTIVLNEKFNEAEAQRLLKPGKNTIEGSAVWRQLNGGIQKCSGYKVDLLPSTKYAEERMKHLYGNAERGINQNRVFIFQPNEEKYHKLVRTTYCDIDGKFSFENVQDGTFFITTQILWEVQVNQYTTQTYGGVLMQKVTVKGGEKKKIVLSP
jgi:hypothetical protein